jgi:hypothetical protein
MQPLLQIFCPAGQLVAHAGVPDWQPNPQVVVPGIVQVPLPSQVDAGCRVEPLQLALPQDVPDALYVQAPEPLQLPSRPQAVASVGQSVADLVPALIEAHVPSGMPVSALRHDMQLPVQPLLQQTPSTQFPEVHWSLPLGHDEPLLILLPQVVPPQY